MISLLVYVLVLAQPDTRTVFFIVSKIEYFVSIRSQFPVVLVEALEGGALFIEKELHLAHGSVSVFCDNDIGDIFSVGVRPLPVFPINKKHDIGVLLDGSRLSKIGKFWYLGIAGLNSTRELRDCKNWDIELPGEALQRPRDLR